MSELAEAAARFDVRACMSITTLQVGEGMGKSPDARAITGG